MIIYTEFHDAALHVIAVPNMNAPCATTITCNLDYDFSQETWVLSRKNTAMIDAILDSKTIMVWESPEDMDKFICLIRRHSSFRVAKISFLLPVTVISRLRISCPVTPAILIAALTTEGIKTEADLRKLKNVSSGRKQPSDSGKHTTPGKTNGDILQQNKTQQLLEVLHHAKR